MITEAVYSLLSGKEPVERVSDLQNLAYVTTDFFFVLIVALFLLSLFFLRKKQHPQFTDYAPTLLASLGILGTFAGIIIGLIAFDPNKIDNSISDLLGGLQTGFLTSLLGIFLSITYKVIESIVSNSDSSEDDSQSTLDDTSILLKQSEQLEKIAKALSDENSETSLLNFMKLYRSDTNDFRKEQMQGLNEIKEILIREESIQKDIDQKLVQAKEVQQIFEEKLWDHMQNFAEMLSKSATEQVIDALNSVIKDFNQKLTEQFGKNFEELNNAVYALVEWQENYRIQIQDMTSQYAQGVQAITQTESSVANISHESQKIPEVMSALKSVLEVNQHQINGLNDHLDVFTQMRDKAIDAVPQINQRIDETITGVSQASEQLSNAIIKTAHEFDDSATKVNGSLQSTSDHLSTTSEEIKQLLSDAVSQMNENLRNLVTVIQDEQTKLLNQQNESTKTLINSYEQAEKQIEQFSKNTLKSTEDTVRKQVGQLDQQLEQEINKTMSEMGGALTSITSRFTQDYKLLVEQMQQVINTNTRR